jgi:hypothetical protein
LLNDVHGFLRISRFGGARPACHSHTHPQRTSQKGADNCELTALISGGALSGECRNDAPPAPLDVGIPTSAHLDDWSGPESRGDACDTRGCARCHRDSRNDGSTGPLRTFMRIFRPQGRLALAAIRSRMQEAKMISHHGVANDNGNRGQHQACDRSRISKHDI